MNNKKIKEYFKKGLTFLREHPQLWFTGLVGLSIVLSFLFVAWQFARIAYDAQEELVNVRAGSILDVFVVFAPEALINPETVRAKISTLRKENPTIESFTVYAQHGNDAWRVYVSENGPREGSVVSGVPIVFGLAQANPGTAFTSEIQDENGRHFVTARAITDGAGKPMALAVAFQGMAEADKQILNKIQMSTYILLGVLFVITIIFFRHARIVDFSILYKKQLEVDEMKDSFISMASHELKSPLSVIRGYIEFLKEGVQDEEKRKEYLRRIDLSAEELRQLVDDILDVSRIEMGRLRFSVEYVRPAEVLHEVFDMFTDSANKKNLNFLIDLEGADVNAIVRVDRGRLKQVIINLTSNAIKYTQSGDVIISLRTQGAKAELAVKDTGIGMTTEEQKRLFSKFYRIEAEESKGVSGTGLGLWITKYITEHMNGDISVESIKGEGSRFVVTFSLHKK